MHVDVVYVSAWVSSFCFFASRSNLISLNPYLRFVDATGCVILWLHILLAYYFVHDGSHSAAVAHVAERTRDTVGIETGVGIYANFLVAGVWSALLLMESSSRLRRRAAEAFLWVMFISASILFAQWQSASAFTVIVLLVGISHLFPHTAATPEDELRE